MADRRPVRPQQPVRERVERVVVEDAGGADTGDELGRAPPPPPFGAQQHGGVDGADRIVAVVEHEQLDRLLVAGAASAHPACHQQPVQIGDRRGGPELGEVVVGDVIVDHGQRSWRASRRLMLSRSNGTESGPPVQSSTGASPRPVTQTGTVASVGGSRTFSHRTVWSQQSPKS